MHARREVILSGGAINSPQLLMLSGIGPASHLREVGVESRVDLAGVGANLQDHPVTPLIWYTRNTTDVAEMSNLKNLMQWKIRGTGPLSSNIGEGGCFFSTREGLPASDIQIHTAPTGFYDNGFHEPNARMFSAAATLVSVASRGSIRLRSADPSWHPAIDAAYLEDQTDLDALLTGARMTWDICTQGALADYLDRPWKLPADADRRRPARAHPHLDPDALPPDLDLRDGLGRGRRGRRLAARARRRGPARRRRLGHARRAARQHQRTHHHGRREGGRGDQERTMTLIDENRRRDRCAPPTGWRCTAEQTFDSLSPITGDVVGTYPIHSAEEVTAAVSAAREHAAWWARADLRRAQGAPDRSGRAR